MKKKQIVFINYFQNPRLFKQAKALKSLGGYELILMLGKKPEQLMYPGLFDQIHYFGANNYLSIANRNLNIKLRKQNPERKRFIDLISKFNPYCFHAYQTAQLWIPYELCLNTTAPVIMDCMDFQSFNYGGIGSLDDQSTMMEKYALENCAGIVRKGPPLEIDYYINYGYKIPKLSLHWLDGCDEDLFQPIKKNYTLKAPPRIAYTGSLSPSADCIFLYYPKLGEIFAKQNIHFYVYKNKDINSREYMYKDYKKLAEKSPYFHWCKHIPYHLLNETINQYDWGCSLNPVYGQKNHYIGHKSKTAIGNRYFSFLEASLPQMASSHSLYFKELIEEENQVGKTFSDQELFDIGERILALDMKNIGDAINQTRNKYSLQKNACDLAQFYETCRK